jgi:hypothetical protein
MWFPAGTFSQATLILTSRTAATLKEVAGEQSENPLAQNVNVALTAGGGTLSAGVEFVWHAENPEIRRSMPASNRGFFRA